MSSAEEAYLALIKSGGGDSTEADTLALFDQLKPILPEVLVGEWDGSTFDFHAQHPVTLRMQQMGWVGKTFRSSTDVDSFVGRGQGGERVPIEATGNARIFEVKFRGIVSATLVFNDKIDYFRYLDENTVAGIYEDKDVAASGLLHFYLTRCPSSACSS
ncbi:hypothetical protein FB45DRAFT_834939 [Roridomyces roridus]|uniref:GXWXG protein n=1 Tax=Roridomyces roridus TaxID=1738132 RepID=A0AAD7FN35_9AGAR|nr:hypothetical protein FB45DRAFT_834939 [Roridomyces roridus]